MQALGFIGALTLGITLLVSGPAKLRDPAGFVLSVLQYDVLPGPLAKAYGRILPLAEAGVGLALVAGLAPVAAGVLGALLLLTFLLGVGVNLARGRDLHCHCFGVGSGEPIGWTTVGRIVMLLACALAVVTWRGSELIEPPPSNALPAALLALALLLALHLMPALVQQWPIWRMTAPAQWREPKRGRVVSLRSYPLVRRLSPISDSEGDGA